jgi:hypothetical protein
MSVQYGTYWFSTEQLKIRRWVLRPMSIGVPPLVLSATRLGGRFGVNATRHVQFEAEMAYDFNQAFTEGFTNTSGGAVTFQQSNLRVLHGLFGPKVSTGGPVRVFLTVKGGFENFRFDPTPASFSTFTSSVGNLRSTNVSGVVYPGLGIEGFLGPIGLRLDAGDEIYCANGARHNLRISFGPTIRF